MTSILCPLLTGCTELVFSDLVSIVVLPLADNWGENLHLSLFHVPGISEGTGNFILNKNKQLLQ